MEMSEREKHIKVLEKLLKETKGRIELYSENKNIDLTKEKETVESLAYAISSLKTDEAYQFMYEGEEIYTKADTVAMLEDLKKEINPIKECEYQIYGKEHWDFVGKCQDVVQQKINELKERTNE